MSSDRICKTVHQYSKEPVAGEDMRRLLEIAEDYRKVKNYVYQRYGGIKSLFKLYPGYTVQNEMTACGLRQELGLPSVYFYLAIFEALGDIKTQWSRVKSDVLVAVNRNERFTPQDKHYLRFVIKMGGCFENILNGKDVELPKEMQKQYESIVAGASDGSKVDAENLNRYLCRQVRKRITSLHTEKADGFGVTERAYRYGVCDKKHGIFLSTKENRKRVFIPLTDENEYKKQLYIKLKPEKSSVEIAAPIEVRVRKHEDYTNSVGISVGIWQMFTTDKGRVYGAQFGKLHEEMMEYINAASQTYQREKDNNAGREKYKAHKARLDAKIKTYVNQEINRMLATEKPSAIYIPKLPGSPTAGHDRKINRSVSIWKRGYVRERLEMKCRENSVQIVEVLGNGIATECSECGAAGKCSKESFHCENCGYEANRKVNAARNAVKRGMTGRKLNSRYDLRESVAQEY